MAPLRGTVTTDRRGGSTASRLASRSISATVATWGRAARVTMYADGAGRIELRELPSGRLVRALDWPPEAEPLELEEHSA